MDLNRSDIISNFEGPGLRIGSFALIKIRGVSTKYKLYFLPCKYTKNLYRLS